VKLLVGGKVDMEERVKKAENGWRSFVHGLLCPIQMRIFHSNESFLLASFLPPKKEGQ